MVLDETAPLDDKQVLQMNGGYADTPSCHIQLHSFTIGIWVKLTQAASCHLYSDWSHPWSFYLALAHRGLAHRLAHRGESTMQVTACLRRNIDSAGSDPLQDMVGCAGGTVTAGPWHHVAMSWDRESGLLRLFVDGVLVEEGKRNPHAAKEVDVQVNQHTTHQIGLKKDSSSEKIPGSVCGLQVRFMAMQCLSVEQIFEGAARSDADMGQVMGESGPLTKAAAHA